MATNEILQFAETDTGTNLLTQAEYLADAQRPIGNQPGVARSKLVNKALRQSSLIAAAVAQFIADNQANNVVDTATPANIADWIEAAVRSIGIPTAVAGGTADAITADFTPNVALTNGTTVIVRAGAANATTTPTFAPDGLAAKTIVKGNNLALDAGDIAGAGHWLEMNFDTTLDKWVLQNPAKGIAIDAGASIVAQSKNLRCFNNTGTPGSQIDLTADEIVLKDSSGKPLLATNVSATANILVNGANGLDTGAAANNTWYYLWVISNGSTTALLFSTSSTAPTMPVGYTFRALVSAVYRTTAFRNFVQRQNRIQAAETAAQWTTLSGGTATSITAISMATFVPPIHTKVTIRFQQSTPSAVGQSTGNIYSGNNGNKIVGSVLPYSGGSAQSDTNNVTFIPEVAQTYYYNVSNGSASHFVNDFEI